MASQAKAWQFSWMFSALSLLLTFFSMVLSYSAFFSVKNDPEAMVDSVVFASTLLFILVAHEAGHFCMAYRLGIRQSPPLFLPAYNLFGTLGAMMFLQEQPHNRSELLKIAVMGPYMGLFVSLLCLCMGLPYAQYLSPTEAYQGLILGHSMLFYTIEALFYPGALGLELGPIAKAAWTGLFLTSINLMPVGHMDGGHICYALLGPYAIYVSRFVLGGLLLLGSLWMFWQPRLSMACLPVGLFWAFWALLLLLLGKDHQGVQQEEKPLEVLDVVHGMVALLLFLLTFVPVPVQRSLF